MGSGWKEGVSYLCLTPSQSVWLFQGGREGGGGGGYINSRGSNGLDTSQDCQSNTQPNVHITQDSVAANQEDAPGRPG